MSVSVTVCLSVCVCVSVLYITPVRGVGDPVSASAAVSSSIDLVGTGVLVVVEEEEEGGKALDWPPLLELRLLLELRAEERTELLRLDPGEGGGGRLAYREGRRVGEDSVRCSNSHIQLGLHPDR